MQRRLFVAGIAALGLAAALFLVALGAAMACAVLARPCDAVLAVQAVASAPALVGAGIVATAVVRTPELVTQRLVLHRMAFVPPEPAAEQSLVAGSPLADASVPRCTACGRAVVARGAACPACGVHAPR